MPRVPLLLCLVALLGSTVSAWLFFRIGNSKQELQIQLTEAGARAARLDADLARAHEQSGALHFKLGSLGQEIHGLKLNFSAAEVRADQLSRDLKAARNDLQAAKEVLAVYESTARSLADDVTGLRQELVHSRASNASPEAVAGYRTTIAELERQLATARNGAAATATVGASTAVFSSRAGRATVLTVGPESAFVVLNFGSARGAQLGQRLAVSQGLAEVATLRISDVRLNFSVAQVLPETLRGTLHKGDLAVLIR